MLGGLICMAALLVLALDRRAAIPPLTKEERMKELTKEEAVAHRAYLLDVLAEIADGSICFESVRKAQQAIDKIKNE